MANFAGIAIRSPQPFDIVGDNFSLCGLGRANEGVLGKAVLKDKNGVVLAQVAAEVRSRKQVLVHAVRLPGAGRNTRDD